MIFAFQCRNAFVQFLNEFSNCRRLFVFENRWSRKIKIVHERRNIVEGRDFIRWFDKMKNNDMIWKIDRNWNENDDVIWWIDERKNDWIFENVFARYDNVLFNCSVRIRTKSTFVKHFDGDIISSIRQFANSAWLNDFFVCCSNFVLDEHMHDNKTNRYANYLYANDRWYANENNSNQMRQRLMHVELMCEWLICERLKRVRLICEISLCEWLIQKQLMCERLMRDFLSRELSQFIVFLLKRCITRMNSIYYDCDKELIQR